MSFPTLLYGKASDVQGFLYAVDPSAIKTDDLIAVLVNAFGRIDALERQVAKLQSNVSDLPISQENTDG